MKDINSLTIVGRLVRDAELKYTNSGTPVASTALASTSTVKRGDSWEEEANFFDFAIIGTRAEALAKYMTKGKQVAITGSIKQDRWTDPDGQTKSKVSIRVDDIQLLGGKDS